MRPQERARALRPLIEAAAASLPDEEALEAVELFPAWAAGTDYAAKIRARYEGKLYRCEQAHRSQEGWEPDKTPALWTEVAEPGEIPVWVQPSGAQDAYNTGDKVWYPAKDTVVWVSTMDGNTWPPDVYGWKEAGL